MSGNLAAAISSAELSAPFTAISMFDCPLATHTSPTATFFTVSVFLPATIKSLPEPGARPWSLVLHLPFSSAVALADLSPRVTVTFSPGSAVPHTFAFESWSRTMLSLMSAGSFTSADAVSEQPRNAARAGERNVFMGKGGQLGGERRLRQARGAE